MVGKLQSFRLMDLRPTDGQSFFVYGLTVYICFSISREVAPRPESLLFSPRSTAIGGARASSLGRQRRSDRPRLVRSAGIISRSSAPPVKRGFPVFSSLSGRHRRGVRPESESIMELFKFVSNIENVLLCPADRESPSIFASELIIEVYRRKTRRQGCRGRERSRHRRAGGGGGGKGGGEGEAARAGELKLFVFRSTIVSYCRLRGLRAEITSFRRFSSFQGSEPVFAPFFFILVFFYFYFFFSH